MKCTHCGGNIGIEDKICPYCGAPNEQALEHQADMRRFEASFKETQAHVEERTSRFSRMAVPITLAVILLLAMAASVLFASRSYDIGRSLARRELAGHAADYQLQIDEWLSEKDYLNLYAFYENKNLYMLSGYDGGPLESYEMVFRASGYYSQFFEMLMQRMEPGSFYYKPERISATCSDLADLLDRLYSISREDYFPEGCYSQERLADVTGMQAQAQALLQTYAGFSREEAAGVSDYSKGRLQVMLEEKIETLMQEVEPDENN